MTKELTPLEALDKILNQNTLSVPERKVISFREKYKEEVDIIETILKNEDKEKLDLIQQVRELKDEIASLKSFNSKLWVERQDNEKRLKALEIIKEKNIEVGSFKRFIKHTENTLKIWNFYVREESDELTQEEYDLLKEVLL